MIHVCCSRVYVYICIHTHVRVYIYICIHTHVRTYTHTHTHTCTHIHITHTHMYAHTHYTQSHTTCMHTLTSTCAHTIHAVRSIDSIVCVHSKKSQHIHPVIDVQLSEVIHNCLISRWCRLHAYYPHVIRKATVSCFG